MVKSLKRWIDTLQTHVNNWWYGPALALMACADLFVVVIPTDALLISACMLATRRWIYFAFMVALGSSVGALILAEILQHHGLPLLLKLAPSILETKAWTWTVWMMGEWGIWALFLVSLSPLMQHPAVALAAVSGMALYKIFLMVFAGRLIKYLFLAWLSTHAPGVLGKIWGVRDELKELPPPAR